MTSSLPWFCVGGPLFSVQHLPSCYLWEQCAESGLTFLVTFGLFTRLESVDLLFSVFTIFLIYVFLFLAFIISLVLFFILKIQYSWLISERVNINWIINNMTYSSIYD